MSRTAHPRRHRHVWVLVRSVLEFLDVRRSERRCVYRCEHAGCFASKTTKRLERRR